MTTTMKAIVQETYGSADVLELRGVEAPTAGAGEVLLRVHAAGVSRGDVHLMQGEPYLVRAAVGFRRPKNPVPGRDVAGTVVAIGPDVTRFAVGDEVFGIARGSFAEYAVAREDKLAHKPTTLTFPQAAAMPVSGLTALRAVDAADIRAGQSVLVVGASGGVGTYAVQLAVAAGASVTGVASGAKARLVQDLGASGRHRLHARGLRRRLAHVRRHARHRRRDADRTPATRPHPHRDAGHRRWRERRHLEPGHGPPAARACCSTPSSPSD